jgi:sugar transferase EpsL
LPYRGYNTILELTQGARQRSGHGFRYTTASNTILQKEVVPAVLGGCVKAMQLAIKRLIDITAALVGLVVLAPLLLAVAALICRSMGRPILFRQARPGMHGKIFTVVKFRTMSDARDEFGGLLPDALRLTALGKFLRATSIDELPQLWNVLKGELSLVGPRPLLIQYLELYTPEQMRRHDVKPGITGWAQVNGRNDLTWEDKFTLDVWYVDHWSLLLDAKILLLTVIKVLKREGISQPGQATAAPFKGSKQQQRG